MEVQSSESRKDAKRAANILICARKMKRFTQSHVTQNLGLAQSTLSRIEAGILVPSVLTWMDLTELLDIPVDALRYGVLDSQTNTDIRTGTMENGFKLPRIYSKNRCLKVRSIYPLVRFVEEKYGDKKLKQITKELGVDRDFFTCFDNQINLKFVDDFVNYLRAAFDFSEESMKEVIEIGMGDSVIHGRLMDSYKSTKSAMELIQQYLKNYDKYQAFLMQRILHADQSEIKLQYSINPMIKDQLQACTPFTLQVIERVKRAQIVELIKLVFGPNAALFGNVAVEVERFEPTNMEIVYSVQVSQ